MLDIFLPLGEYWQAKMEVYYPTLIKLMNQKLRLKLNPLNIYLLIKNHGEVDNKDKIEGYLPLEHIFGFCKTFWKVTKQLGFRITFKTVDL